LWKQISNSSDCRTLCNNRKKEGGRKRREGGKRREWKKKKKRKGGHRRKIAGPKRKGAAQNCVSAAVSSRRGYRGAQRQTGPKRKGAAVVCISMLGDVGITALHVAGLCSDAPPISSSFPLPNSNRMPLVGGSCGCDLLSCDLQYNVRYISVRICTYIAGLCLVFEQPCAPPIFFLTHHLFFLLPNSNRMPLVGGTCGCDLLSCDLQYAVPYL
jgi:hypothetical protein